MVSNNGKKNVTDSGRKAVYVLYTNYTKADIHDLFYYEKKRIKESLLHWKKRKSIRKIFEIDPNQFNGI